MYVYKICVIDLEITFMWIGCVFFISCMYTVFLHVDNINYI